MFLLVLVVCVVLTTLGPSFITGKNPAFMLKMRLSFHSQLFRAQLSVTLLLLTLVVSGLHRL